MTSTIRYVPILLLTALSACGGNMVPGQSEGNCDKNPERCMSVREAMNVSDGPASPPPSDAALQRRDVMRVWVAPMRDASGVLQNSGHVYLQD